MAAIGRIQRIIVKPAIEGSRRCRQMMAVICWRWRRTQIGEEPVHTNRVIPSLIGACLIGLALGQPAHAGILISVDKSTQRMTVTVDGRPRYNWPVSTGKPGYDTPNGTYRPFRMDIDHVSEEYGNAPMPYSIFFTTTGDAVHGTYERGLGRAASHGCVRLSVKNAAALWSLVKREKMASTIVQISGSVRHAEGPIVAGSEQMPPAAVAPSQDRRDNQGRQRPLFPFFPFRR
jgi:hypothetical protein